jgi:hypothetical protein
MSSTTARERFFEDHGEHVLLAGEYIFEDGATAEAGISGTGRLMEPPEDDWERAKKELLFYETKAELLVTEFREFKAYLAGEGPCPTPRLTDEELEEAWHQYRCRRGPHPDCLLTELDGEDALRHLQKLRSKAQTAKRYARAAREEVDELEPEFFKRLRQGDSDVDTSKARFKSRVDSIKL